jgi:hypothetical protein
MIEIASYGGKDNYGHDPRDPNKIYNTRFSIHHTLQKRLHNQRYSSPGIQPFTGKKSQPKLKNSLGPNGSLGVRTRDR